MRRHAAAFKKHSGLSWTAMLRNGRALRHGKHLSLGQLLLAANTPMLLKAAMVEDRTETGVMAAGQVAGVIDDLPSVAEAVEGTVHQAAALLRALGARAGDPPAAA